MRLIGLNSRVNWVCRVYGTYGFVGVFGVHSLISSLFDDTRALQDIYLAPCNGFELRVYRFSVKDSGSRAQGLGFGVSGNRYQVPCGFRLLNL